MLDVEEYYLLYFKSRRTKHGQPPVLTESVSIGKMSHDDMTEIARHYAIDHRHKESDDEMRGYRRPCDPVRSEYFEIDTEKFLRKRSVNGGPRRRVNLWTKCCALMIKFKQKRKERKISPPPTCHLDPDSVIDRMIDIKDHAKKQVTSVGVPDIADDVAEGIMKVNAMSESSESLAGDKKTRNKITDAQYQKAVKLVIDERLTQSAAEKQCGLWQGALSTGKGEKMLGEATRAVADIERRKVDEGVGNDFQYNEARYNEDQ